MIGRWIRRLLILALLVTVFGGVGFFIARGMQQELANHYATSVALAVDTAVAGALFDATRTAEAALPHYILYQTGPAERLLDIAETYNTTIDVIRMANNLLPTVDAGNGEEIIVPVGVQFLDPPRRFELYIGGADDTLERLATRFNAPLEIMQSDNPILAQRGINPGDVVFIPRLL
ncbi:MAG: LysM peptidoglycan-binding domain-containing protein [Anaerolineae bacterium]|nr:LysM peptidoglycan-binding domain-containing protein [Anaerolineae bacterium]